MTQPVIIRLTSAQSDPIEAVDLGEAMVLMQRDETGDVQTVSLDRNQALHLALVIASMFGVR